jgi:hypothetical protein
VVSEEISAVDKSERIVAWEILAVVLLMVVGGALRFWGAHAAPGFWYDEAIYALDGLDVWRKPGWPVFFDTEDHMREGLFHVPARARIRDVRRHGRGRAQYFRRDRHRDHPRSVAHDPRLLWYGARG